jgi:TRAP-type C4-dicarboxylate transport system permease small subunit
MELILKLLVVLVQLALAGFVIWGGWLSFREWLRAAHAGAATSDADIRPQGFERVASLVLLALLCTAIVGLG